MKQNSRPSKPNVVSIPHSTHPIYKLPAILKLRQQKHADIPECNAPAEVISLNSPAFKNTRTPRDPTKSDFFVFLRWFSFRLLFRSPFFFEPVPRRRGSSESV
ncbi:hypothetical protein VTJ04DRAFT_4333 [Mycothermus thermophilus]|uniref:uncharacterized protein n=1 Tax=Humicola insolens TaxID=85995 RepID=UPI003742ABF8